jgi:hypothetical protein
LKKHYYNSSDEVMYSNMLKHPDHLHIYFFPKEGNYRSTDYSKTQLSRWDTLDTELPVNHPLRKNFYTVMCSKDSFWPRTYGPNFGNHICWQEFYMYEVFLGERGLRGFDPEHANLPPELTYMYTSRRPRNHRVFTMEYLVDQDLISHGNILFCNDLHSWNNFLNGPYGGLVQKLLPHAPRLFRNDVMEIKHNNAWKTESALPGYEYCLFDIVAETHVEQLLFSEKTLRPLIHGKPFCILGYPGQNQILKKWGFELYDEIFDYCELTESTADANSFQTRIPQMLKSLVDLDKSPASLQDVKQKLLPKTKYNQSVLVKTIFDDSLLPDEFLFPPEHSTMGGWRGMISQVRRTLRNHEYFKQFI